MRPEYCWAAHWKNSSYFRLPLAQDHHLQGQLHHVVEHLAHQIQPLWDTRRLTMPTMGT